MNRDEEQFRKNVELARFTTKKILGNERDALYPADVEHEYDDKYTLAELTVQTAILSQLRCFQDLLKLKDEEKVRAWVKQKMSVTLRFEAEEKCECAREVKRDVESEERIEKTTWFGNKTVETRKIITTVTDYFWTFKSS